MSTIQSMSFKRLNEEASNTEDARNQKNSNKNNKKENNMKEQTKNLPQEKSLRIIRIAAAIIGGIIIIYSLFSLFK